VHFSFLLAPTQKQKNRVVDVLAVFSIRFLHLKLNQTGKKFALVMGTSCFFAGGQEQRNTDSHNDINVVLSGTRVWLGVSAQEGQLQVQMKLIAAIQTVKSPKLMLSNQKSHRIFS
jgi:hypothetical protein